MPRKKKKTNKGEESSNPEKVEKKKKKNPFEAAAKALSKTYPEYSKLTLYDSGSLVFNKILGGGLPGGRYTEIASEAGLGKSTLALQSCLSFAEQGLCSVYLDFEKAINDSLVDGVGLTSFRGKFFTIHKATTFPDAEELMDTYVKVPEVKLIVIDSINSIIPGRYINVPIEDVFAGEKAAIQNRFLLKYRKAITEGDIAVVLVNQVRVKIAQNKFETTKKEAAGGKGLQHYSDIRIIFNSSKQIYRGSGPDRVSIGVDVAAMATKNKVTRPYVRGVLSVIFGQGVSNIRTLSLCLQAEGRAVRKQGSPYFRVSLDPSIDPGEHGEAVLGEVRLEEWIRENYEACLESVKGKGYLEILD